MMKIFDSHAHYDSDRFKDDREEIISSLKEKGVARVMNVASDIESSVTSPLLAEKYDFFYSTVGIHPHAASSVNDEVISMIAKTAELPKVMAIGEIGLDYYYDFSPRKQQREAFVKQLSLAHDLHMPVVIHSRDATEDTLSILKKYRPEGIVHCYSGSAETAIELQKLGLYLGFTGVVTFKNARKAIESVMATDLSRLLIETDCPYMAPVPHRGSRCDSSMLTYIINTIAEIKGISPEELANITFSNANQVYRIKDM